MAERGQLAAAAVDRVRGQLHVCSAQLAHKRGGLLIGGLHRRRPDPGLAYASSGPVGPPNAWAGEECVAWPQAALQDRYTGPWDRPTASTILILGNTGDPTTPYQDSVAVARELARARLLTIDGYGHTAASNLSMCAVGYETGYMLTGALPPPGTVCQQSVVPFPAS
jgi:hypothetical protein